MYRMKNVYLFCDLLKILNVTLIEHYMMTMVI